MREIGMPSSRNRMALHGEASSTHKRQRRADPAVPAPPHAIEHVAEGLLSVGSEAAIGIAPNSILQDKAEQGLAPPHLPAILPVGCEMRFFRIGIAAVERLRIRLLASERKSGAAHALIVLRLAHALLDQNMVGVPGPFADAFFERNRL